ncbi:CACTA en-spm transposon protein [Cucumis melo var. makuwa]|uniref:CACTA en-spm transposon protein n=1 Tax=Cucumis melo var. makuwa TaxID=1194695 RepID=A0A5D3BM58_CUCMM|nr:CACTA en-spm transposon protein [Cucumis melo var. makuwa]TYK00198.1 CACTA en-spm transposon protein [Cucumis melo var. makuwa]
MFLEFKDDLDNIARGSSFVGDNAERHIAINGRIPMTIAPGAEKAISSYVVCFSQAIGVCMRKIFYVYCLKWADVGREYIEVVKGDLQQFFVLDFNDQAMNRFVEHQMLTTFKEFRVDCHRQFKKYSDPKEARANPLNVLVGHHEGLHFLCDHYMRRAFQYELAERKGESIDHVKLFRETHVQAGKFVSQATKDARNQILELQSQPTTKGSQPLSEDELCNHVLGRRPDYSKGLGWGPKPKARKMMTASSSTMSCSQSATEREI